MVLAQLRGRVMFYCWTIQKLCSDYHSAHQNHGVAVSPDASTNGDAEQPEERAASRLAEDSPQTGSTLGRKEEMFHVKLSDI